MLHYKSELISNHSPDNTDSCDYIPGNGGHSGKRQLFLREVFRRCPSLSMWLLLLLLCFTRRAAPAAAVVALFGVALADICL